MTPADLIWNREHVKAEAQIHATVTVRLLRSLKLTVSP